MWEALSMALTGDPNQIQSMPQYSKWAKKNQIRADPDWGQRQWSRELEKLFEGHINGQVPALEPKTVEKETLEDHLKKVTCKISELISRLSALPADLEVMYLNRLYVYLRNEVTSLEKRSFGFEDLVFLYKWTTKEYKLLYSLCQGAENFDPMLFEKWFSDNGSKILSFGHQKIRETLKETLETEISWNHRPSDDLPNCFSYIQGNLTDIFKVVDGISNTIETRLKAALWEEFANFLSRYEDFLEKKMEKSDGITSGKGVLMGLRAVNNCYILRDTLKNSQRTQLDLVTPELLDRCENKGTNVVLRFLSPALEVAFKQFFKKNSPEYENILQEYQRALHSQSMEDKKVFNTKMEHRITILFIKSCFKYGCIPFKSNQRESVVQASQKLLEFFSKEDSDKEQLGTNPLKYMSEIMTTKCHKALQVTIKEFQDEHPDLRREHLLAILKIKGNISRQKQGDLLFYIEERRHFMPGNPLNFFENIHSRRNKFMYFLCCLCPCCFSS